MRKSAKNVKKKSVNVKKLRNLSMSVKKLK